jgi:hypothetical protein
VVGEKGGFSPCAPSCPFSQRYISGARVISVPGR